MKKLALIFVILLGCSTSPSVDDNPCHVARWQVRTLSDPDSLSIVWENIDTLSIDSINRIPRYFVNSYTPRLPFEKHQIVILHCAVVATQLDSITQDYVMFLQDSLGNNLLAVIPSPCVGVSGRANDGLQGARDQAKAIYGEFTIQKKEVFRWVDLTGFLFQNDHAINQYDAKNLIEICPETGSF